MNDAYENFLFRFSKISFVLSSTGLVIRIFLENLKAAPLGMHILDAFWIVPLAAALLSGIALWFVLLQPVYKRVYGAVIGGDWAWLWRLLVGTYMLFLVAVAKVYADHTLVTATSLPAAWFPRSQEIMTGAFFVSFFLISLMVITIFMMILTAVVFLVLATILPDFTIIRFFLIVLTLVFIFIIFVIIIAKNRRLLPEPAEQSINGVDSVSLKLVFDKLPRWLRSSIRSIWYTFVRCRTWFLSSLIYQKTYKITLSVIAQAPGMSVG